MDRRESGEGVPVLFVHGNLSDGAAWREQLGMLPPGLRGIAPDLRAFGGSGPAPIDATRGLGDFRDDLVALLDDLGLGAVHLVGHSMGGGVVMDLASHHPDRVRTITIGRMSSRPCCIRTSPRGRRGTPPDAGIYLQVSNAEEM